MGDPNRAEEDDRLLTSCLVNPTPRLLEIKRKASIPGRRKCTQDSVSSEGQRIKSEFSLFLIFLIFLFLVLLWNNIRKWTVLKTENRKASSGPSAAHWSSRFGHFTLNCFETPGILSLHPLKSCVCWHMKPHEAGRHPLSTLGPFHLPYSCFPMWVRQWRASYTMAVTKRVLLTKVARMCFLYLQYRSCWLDYILFLFNLLLNPSLAVRRFKDISKRQCYLGQQNGLEVKVTATKTDN